MITCICACCCKTVCYFTSPQWVTKSIFPNGSHSFWINLPPGFLVAQKRSQPHVISSLNQVFHTLYCHRLVIKNIKCFNAVWFRLLHIRCELNFQLFRCFGLWLWNFFFHLCTWQSGYICSPSPILLWWDWEMSVTVMGKVKKQTVCRGGFNVERQRKGVGGQTLFYSAC